MKDPETTGALEPEGLVPPVHSMSELGRTGRLPVSREGLTIELAVRIGDMLSANGVSTNDTTIMMYKIARAYGLDRVHIDITYNSISASYYPGEGLPPVTSLRTVRPVTVEFTKVTQLEGLVDDIVAGKPLMQAIRAFDLIRAAPPSYPGWVARIGSASIPMFFQMLFTDSWQVLVLGFLTGLMVDTIMRTMSRRGYPIFFQHVAAASFVVIVIAVMSQARSYEPVMFASLRPTLIAVGGIIQMAAGTKFVAAGEDAIDGFYVTASARLLQVAMLTAGIVVGFVVMLKLAGAAGFFVEISANPVSLGPDYTQYIGAGGAAAMFAVSGYANRRTVIWAGISGVVAWGMYRLGLALEVGEIAACFMGAFIAAFLATFVGRSNKIPGVALVSGAMLPLVPGLKLYYGMMQIMGTPVMPSNPTLGLSTLGIALGVGLAMSAGSSLGTFLGRPADERLRRLPSSLKKLRIPGK